jgi:hypothetical protein
LEWAVPVVCDAWVVEAADLRGCGLPTFPSAAAGKTASISITTVAARSMAVSEETAWAKCPQLLFVHAHGERDTSLFSCYLDEGTREARSLRCTRT